MTDRTASTRSSEVAHSAFAQELRLRMVEAQASLRAAEALDDPLLAQIAESDLADMQALAARNDVEAESEPDPTGRSGP